VPTCDDDDDDDDDDDVAKHVPPGPSAWCGLPGWTAGKHAGAYLVSPQMPGAVFSMCLVRMDPGCVSAFALPGVERFILLVEGSVKGFVKGYAKIKGMQSTDRDGEPTQTAFTLEPGKDEYAFFPADDDAEHEFTAGEGGAVVLMYEQVYRDHPCVRPGDPAVIFGNVDKQPMLDPGAPEVRPGVTHACQSHAPQTPPISPLANHTPPTCRLSAHHPTTRARRVTFAAQAQHPAPIIRLDSLLAVNRPRPVKSETNGKDTG